MTVNQLYEAISTLPVAERLRLVERVVHDVAQTPGDVTRKPTASGSSLDGLFADIPHLVDEVCADAYRDRAMRRPEDVG
jgi:hypothetical protein